MSQGKLPCSFEKRKYLGSNKLILEVHTTCNSNEKVRFGVIR